MEFLQHNLFWAVAAVVSFVAYVWNLTRSEGGDLTPQAVVHLINREHGVLVDVREKAEYSKSHLGGARSFPLGELQDRLGELEKAKAAPIIVYGAAKDVARAVKLLQARGFVKAAGLQGGIEGWTAAGMPVES